MGVIFVAYGDGSPIGGSLCDCLVFSAMIVAGPDGGQRAGIVLWRALGGCLAESYSVWLRAAIGLAIVIGEPLDRGCRRTSGAATPPKKQVDQH